MDTGTTGYRMPVKRRELIANFRKTAPLHVNANYIEKPQAKGKRNEQSLKHTENIFPLRDDSPHNGQTFRIPFKNSKQSSEKDKYVAPSSTYSRTARYRGAFKSPCKKSGQSVLLATKTQSRPQHQVAGFSQDESSPKHCTAIPTSSNRKENNEHDENKSIFKTAKEEKLANGKCHSYRKVSTKIVTFEELCNKHKITSQNSVVKVPLDGIKNQPITSKSSSVNRCSKKLIDSKERVGSMVIKLQGSEIESLEQCSTGITTCVQSDNKRIVRRDGPVIKKNRLSLKKREGSVASSHLSNTKGSRSKVSHRDQVNKNISWKNKTNIMKHQKEQIRDVEVNEVNPPVCNSLQSSRSYHSNKETVGELENQSSSCCFCNILISPVSSTSPLTEVQCSSCLTRVAGEECSTHSQIREQSSRYSSWKITCSQGLFAKNRRLNKPTPSCARAMGLPTLAQLNRDVDDFELENSFKKYRYTVRKKTNTKDFL